MSVANAVYCGGASENYGLCTRKNQEITGGSMAKEALYTVGGAILGSLVEEGIEEVLPGARELGLAGEISGGVAGVIGSEFFKEETKNAIQSFVKFTYRQINRREADGSISEEELRLFTEKFDRLPASKKKEIIANFRNLAPHEYDFIVEFLNDLSANPSS